MHFYQGQLPLPPPFFFLLEQNNLLLTVEYSFQHKSFQLEHVGGLAKT